MKNRLPLVAATVLGILALLGLNSYVQSMERTLKKDLSEVEVVVAAQEIQAGSKLTKSSVKLTAVPDTYVVNESIRASELDIYLGRKVMVNLADGQQVLSLHFGVSGVEDELIEHRVHPGKRAVAITIDQVAGLSQGVAGMLRPGHHVDVMGTFNVTFHSGRLEGETTWETYTLLENKPVLAVDSVRSSYEVSDPFDSKTLVKYSSVTLEVTPEEAQVLALAQTRGRIHLTLRNPDDTADVRPQAVDIDSIIEKCRRGKSVGRADKE